MSSLTTPQRSEPDLGFGLRSPSETRVSQLAAPVNRQPKFQPSCITWFVSALTAGWLASIWILRFLPMDDYPTWIYAGRLFSELIRNAAPSCYSLVPYPVPNTLFVGITGLLDLFVDPETSGKIFLSFSVLLFVVGSYRLIGSMSTRRDSPLLLLPLL